MTVKTMAYPAKFTPLENDETPGRVEALVSVFGNVDLMNDRVVKGAFSKSIQKWKASGDPIPVIVSHNWGDIWSHVGAVDDLEETDTGLKATYTLDVADNPAAAQVYRLMKRRTLKEHSFAYKVNREKSGKDGANELLELDIIEVGPTLKGVNPETELLAVKSALEVAAEEKKPDTKEDEPWVLENNTTTNNSVIPNTTATDTSVTITGTEVKVGRRVSRATESEVRSRVRGIRAELDALESLLPEEDKATPEEEKPRVEVEAGNGKTSDDVLLRLKAQLAHYMNQEV